MSIIKSLISDLSEQLYHLKQYEDLEEIPSAEITPLWWTDRYDGEILAGFCEYNSEVLRFQIVFSDQDLNLRLYCLTVPTTEQLAIEQERIDDFVSMAGTGRNYIKEKGKWDPAPIKREGNVDMYWAKHLDDKHVAYKKQTDYSTNKPVKIFYIGDV